MKCLNFVIVMILVPTVSCEKKTEKFPSKSCDSCQEVKFGGEGVSVMPDVFAKYPGGVEGIAQHIKANINYPDSARSKGIQGKVLVSYVVSAKGDVEQVKIVKGVSEDLDNEAIRVIKIMDQWLPAYKDGEPIDLEYVQPIRFAP